MPRQHGAWTMLTFPFLVGAVRGGWHPAQLPLLISWVVGYFGFSAAGLWLKSRKVGYRAPTLVYGAVSAAAGVALLVMRPGLAWWALPVAPLAAVSLWYSSRRNDRSIVNDAVTILAACLMCLVAASAGRLGSVRAAITDAGLLQCTLALALYFVGTSLYVKTLIRERRSRGYKVASIAYHAAATLLALTAWWLVPAASRFPLWACAALVVFFAVATVRAAVLAGRSIRPMTAGLGEIGMSVALSIILLLAG